MLKMNPYTRAPSKYRSASSPDNRYLDKLASKNLRLARMRWGALTPQSLQNLKSYTQEFVFSIIAGDLLLLNSAWYVTHTGLIRLARRTHCAGIDVKPVAELSTPSNLSMGIQGYGLQVTKLSRLRRLRRRRSLECFSRRAWRGNARRRNTCCESRFAKGLRNWHLLCRGDRISQGTVFILTPVEKASAATHQRELRRTDRPRPPVPDYSTASARCHPGQVIRYRLLRGQITSRSHARAGRKLRSALGRLGRERP